MQGYRDVRMIRVPDPKGGTGTCGRVSRVSLRRRAVAGDDLKRVDVSLEQAPERQVATAHLKEKPQQR